MQLFETIVLADDGIREYLIALNLLLRSTYNELADYNRYQYIYLSIDRNTAYIFLVLFMENNCFTNLIDHQFQLRC